MKDSKEKKGRGKYWAILAVLVVIVAFGPTEEECGGPDVMYRMEAAELLGAPVKIGKSDSARVSACQVMVTDESGKLWTITHNPDQGEYKAEATGL